MQPDCPGQAPSSATAGYLQPGRPDQLTFDHPDWGLDAGHHDVQASLEGQNLEDYLQQFIAGVACMDPRLVRPRWQPEPPNIPDYGVDWCSVGITRHTPIGPYPAVIHHSENEGHSELQRHEELDVLATFYGPNADEIASNLHSGLGIWQNYSVLRLVGLAFIEIGEAIKAPELIKNRYWNRVDKQICFRRIIRREYPVLNLLSAGGWVHAWPTDYRAPFTVEPPP